jgi:hypothetical protein
LIKEQKKLRETVTLLERTGREVKDKCQEEVGE